MKASIKLTAASMLGSLALVAAASAAPISMGPTACTSFTGLTELHAAPISCAMFDSNLGTLLSMTLELSASISGTISLTNSNSFPILALGGTHTSFFLGPLTSFTFAVPFANASFTYGDLLIAGATSLSGVIGSGAVLAAVPIFDDFDSYEAAGGGLFAVNADTLTTLSTAIGGGGSVSIIATTRATFTGTVTYVYDEVTTPIPEPTSMALALVGLAAAGVARRRRVQA